jgi:hypothetical protein
MKIVSLDFIGYWTSINPILSQQGIYCIYRGVDKGDTVEISELLYVGESEDVQDRIRYHDRFADWKRQLYSGESLIFSMAKTTSSVRLQCEAAIINHHKPKLNSEYCDFFPYEDIEVVLTGKTAELSSRFKVRSTSLASLYGRVRQEPYRKTY